MSYSNVIRSADQINQAMGRVYGYMAMATLISMAVSFFVGTNPELLAFFFSGLTKWLVIFAPLVAVFVLVPFMGANPPVTLAVAALAGFSVLMGLSFSVIFAMYTLGSIFSAFMSAGILFGVMSFYGYFTKKDLSGVGQFMFVGLITIIIVSLINIFIGSTLLQLAISAVAVIIFLGLTAYDTQQIREMVTYDSGSSIEVMGALQLYLDFINLFLNLLQLFGVSKSND